MSVSWPPWDARKVFAMEAKVGLKTVLVNLDFVMATIMLCLLVALTVFGVFMRYVMSSPLTWMEEVQLACMVWIVFSGAGATFRQGSHVAIELLVDALPAKAQQTMAWVIMVIVIATLSYLLIQSVAYVQFFVNNGRSTSILRIPYAGVYSIVPVSILSMMVNYVLVQVSHLKAQGKETL